MRYTNHRLAAFSVIAILMMLPASSIAQDSGTTGDVPEECHEYFDKMEQEWHAMQARHEQEWKEFEAAWSGAPHDDPQRAQAADELAARQDQEIHDFEAAMRQHPCGQYMDMAGPVPDDGSVGWHPSEACMAYEEERWAAMDEVHRRHEAGWTEMDATWRAIHDQWNQINQEWDAFWHEHGDHHFDAVGDGAASDDPVRDAHPEFFAKMGAWEQDLQQQERDLRLREIALRDQRDADIEAVLSQYPDKDECFPPEMADWVDRCGFVAMTRSQLQFERQQEQLRSEFEASMQAKYDRFQAEMDAQWQAFEQGNHTSQEWDAFAADMEAQWQQFDAKMQAEWESFDLRTRQEWRSFDREIREACMGPPMRADGVMDEFHRQARACELKAHERILAFEDELDAEWEAFAATNPGHEAWIQFEQEQHERLRIFEETVWKETEACFDEVHRQWESQMDDHYRDADPSDVMGSWSISGDESTGIIQLRGTYVALDGDTTTNTLTKVRVGPVEWFQLIAPDTRFDEACFRMGQGDQGASVLTGCGPGVRFAIHDNPVGLMHFETEGDACIFLTVHKLVAVSEADDGLVLTASGTDARIRGDASWDAAARLVSVCDGAKAKFLVPGAKNPLAGTDESGSHAAIAKGRADKKIGAEVNIARQAGSDASGVQEEVLAYEDVGVQVGVQRASEGQAAVVEVTFDADLQEGKTFVVNLDAGILGAGDRVVKHYIVDPETGVETAQEIHMADSIEEVIACDTGQTSYVLVKGAKAEQLLVCIGSWSVHRITFEAAGVRDFETVPGPGAFAVILVATFVAVAMAARRRD